MELKQYFQIGHFRPLALTSGHDDPLKLLHFEEFIQFYILQCFGARDRKWLSVKFSVIFYDS